MALDLLDDEYKGLGGASNSTPTRRTKNFIGGLAPDNSDGGVGLRFKATPGVLMEAAALASADLSRPYLLHIDEINRAD